MRTRSTTTGAFDVAYQWWHHQLVPLSSPTVTYTTYGGYRKVKTIVDVDTPHFMKLVECGKFLPLNPVTITTTEEWRDPWSGSHDAVRNSDHVTISTDYGSFVSDPTQYFSVPAVDDSIVNLVMTSAMANAASFDWDVLTFLAELHKSVEAIAGIGRAFNHFTYALAMQARQARRNPYAKFRELWLGARYTVRPMMYDALNAAQAFSDKLGDSDIIKGRGMHTVSGSDSHVAVTTSNPFVTTTDTIEWERVYRAFVYLQLGDAYKHRFGADGLQTAWELIPYSFVVDWFINIGRYLAAVSPTLSGQWLGRGVSVKTSWTIQTDIDVEWNHNYGSYTDTGSASGGRKKVVGKEYTRFAYDGVPYPSWNPRITLPKLIDLVALFVGGRTRVFRVLSGRK